MVHCVITQEEQIALLRQQVAHFQTLDRSLASPPDTPSLQHVKVENVNMPFIALTGLLVKVALASIPAVIIVYGLLAVLIVVLGMFFGGLAGPLNGLN